jgi:hypothetical protein
MKKPNQVGDKIGLWTVESFERKGQLLFCLVRCDCGTRKLVRRNNLVGGRSTSCGCVGIAKRNARDDYHGLRGTPEYNTWRGMLQRCQNPSNDCYKQYGGRGIRVCERWQSFELFLEDMGPKPNGGIHSIDRIDVNGNYEPSNCRWATAVEQINNRRNTKYVTLNGTRIPASVAYASSSRPVSFTGFIKRLKRGWDPSRALSAASEATR